MSTPSRLPRAAITGPCLDCLAQAEVQVSNVVRGVVRCSIGHRTSGKTTNVRETSFQFCRQLASIEECLELERPSNSFERAVVGSAGDPKLADQRVPVRVRARSEGAPCQRQNAYMACVSGTASGTVRRKDSCGPDFSPDPGTETRRLKRESRRFLDRRRGAGVRETNCPSRFPRV